MDSRPTIAEIDLGALRHNHGVVQRSLPARCGILAVVKADAYGHGFMDVARELEKLGVTAFGVAFLAEGIQLRKSGIDRPVLILGGVYPGQERKCIGYNLSTAVFSLEQLAALDHAAGKLYRRARVHVKIDTGMGRLGIPHDEAEPFFRELHRFGNIELEGVISHFATSDELTGAGSGHTTLQEERFRAVIDMVRGMGLTPTYVHIANSAALFTRELPYCNLARPGIVLYGSLPSADFVGRLDVRPVMTLKSRIAMLKWVAPGTSVSYGRRYVAGERRLIASVPVGYADGYSRALTNRGEALVRGRRAEVVGTVCMDWIMLDVTSVPDAAVGDEVVLMGCDGKGNCIGAEELAERAGTISYEIFCGISKRVPRVYKDSER
jgi:alanine racemase